jgi:hypothetical protein
MYACMHACMHVSMYLHARLAVSEMYVYMHARIFSERYVCIQVDEESCADQMVVCMCT